VTAARLLHVALVLVLFGSSVGLAAAACLVAITDRQEAKRQRAQVSARTSGSARLTRAAAVTSPARRAA
jgi:hypothetical protein